MDLLSQTMQERARVKIERALSFSGGTSDMEGHLLPKKMRAPRDQMSHRIIEKRRRDRMNNCLANLGQLIPVTYLKQGQGRIEKTEIIEMATQHIQQLQAQVQAMSSMERPCCQEKFLMGYKECRDEVMRFLVEMAGYEAADPFCLSLLKHLHNQSKKFVPESASSVYQSSHSPHIGGEFTMPQNAGEVGGMMRLSENSTDRVSPLASPSTSSKPSATSPVIATSTTNWTASSVSPPQKNIYTDVNNYLKGPPISKCTVLGSDSGYSAHSVAPPRSPHIVPSPSEKSSGIGGTPSSSSPETTLPEGGDVATSKAQSHHQSQAYKFKNDIKQRFSNHTGSLDKMQDTDYSSDLSKHNTDSPPEATESSSSHSRKQECKEGTSIATSQADSSSSSSVRSSTTHSTWNPQSMNKKPKTSPSAMLTSSFPMCSIEEDNDEKPSNHVPAFALHPMGTCYIPLVISTSVMEPFLRTHSAPLGICHPVSIPVNFNRPEPVVLMSKPESGKLASEHTLEKPSDGGNGLKRRHEN